MIIKQNNNYLQQWFYKIWALGFWKIGFVIGKLNNELKLGRLSPNLVKPQNVSGQLKKATDNSENERT